jgi:hypothetical protein
VSWIDYTIQGITLGSVVGLLIDQCNAIENKDKDLCKKLINRRLAQGKSLKIGE